MKVTTFLEVHQHIDNGGVSIKLAFSEVDGVVSPIVSMDANYHGYPSVSSSIVDFGGQLSPSFYRDVGIAFMKFAAEIDIKRQAQFFLD